jgi:hypothetical protein
MAKQFMASEKNSAGARFPMRKKYSLLNTRVAVWKSAKTQQKTR